MCLIASKKTHFRPLRLSVPTKALDMVVVNSEPSTSTPRRKNRRSLHKKKTAAISQSTAKKTGVDVDQEMEPVDQEVYSPEPQATTSAADTVTKEIEQSQPGDVGDDEVMIDIDPTTRNGLAPSSAPSFPALTGSALQASLKSEMRRIPIPPHRMSPLKRDWINIFGPLTEILGLQVRVNIQRKAVEIRVRALQSKLHSTISVYTYPYFGRQTSKHTKEIGSLQKGADFVKAYTLGFDVNVSSIVVAAFVDAWSLNGMRRIQLPSYGWTISTLTPSKLRTSKPCKATTSPGL